MSNIILTSGTYKWWTNGVLNPETSVTFLFCSLSENPQGHTVMDFQCCSQGLCSKSSFSVRENHDQQEYITVGCVPSAAVAV